MRYFVAGEHRTGTSAITHAIVTASNLTAFTDAAEEARIVALLGSDANPFGFYANAHITDDATTWIDQVNDDQVCKLSMHNLATLPTVLPCQMILTDRDSEQIAASWLATFGRAPVQSELDERVSAFAAVNAHSEIQIVHVNFAELIDTPLAVFTALAAAGWPIDAEIAASTIDPALYRNR